jgi:FkbM family methyltransferase
MIMENCMQQENEHPGVICDTQTGVYWLPDNSIGPRVSTDPVLNTIRSGSLFDEYVVRNSLPFITPGSTVIDVGANYGQMCIQWSKAVGPSGHVHAFECSTFVSHFLKKTMALNDTTRNVKVHTEAVWHTAGIPLKMLQPNTDGTPGHYYSGAGIRGEDERDSRTESFHEVISTTLDSIEYETKVSLIKVDAQGSDFYVLKGAEKTLIEHKPLIVFEYENMYDNIFGVSLAELDDWLRSLGFVHRSDIFNNGHDFFYAHSESK